jgi:hypothetical protein
VQGDGQHDAHLAAQSMPLSAEQLLQLQEAHQMGFSAEQLQAAQVRPGYTVQPDLYLLNAAGFVIAKNADRPPTLLPGRFPMALAGSALGRFLIPGGLAVWLRQCLLAG